MLYSIDSEGFKYRHLLFLGITRSLEIRGLMLDENFPVKRFKIDQFFGIRNFTWIFFGFTFCAEILLKTKNKSINYKNIATTFHQVPKIC